MAVFLKKRGDWLITMYEFTSAPQEIENNYNKGEAGEIAVEEILKKLPDSYDIIPDVIKPKGGNIDVVVIGPTGIFALEVKNRKYAKVDFDGQSLTFYGQHWHPDPLTQTIKNATCLGKYLQSSMWNYDLFVNPILVFAGPMNIHFGLHKIKGVAQVICKEWLLDVIENKAPIFSQEEISNIAEKVKEFGKIYD